MKRWIFLLAITVALPAIAATSYSTGSQTLSVNESESDLIQALGQPSQKVPMEDSRGRHLSDYYYYTIDKKTVRFLIHNGRVEEIYEMKS